MIAKRFRKIVQKDKAIRNAYLLVHSDRRGFHVNLAEGMTGKEKANSNQPFFIANIGKLFTAVLVAILVEERQLRFEDNISKYLDDDILDNLHVYKETDYSGQIQIHHLLNHTSGIHDFFEDKPKNGKPMFELVLAEPNRTWSPRDVILWSKNNLNSHFPPGEGFYYSDTGYHLLGLVVEQITGLALPEAMKQYIFEPLGMKHSFLIQCSYPIEEKSNEIADVYYRNNNIIHDKSLGIFYGVGIVAPPKDLLKFMKAVVNHTIITSESLERMSNWAKFAPGIDYGYGIMKFTPSPMVLPKKYSLWGHAGITGSFMFYHPELETYIIGSLNNFFEHRKGIKLVFKVIDELLK